MTSTLTNLQIELSDPSYTLVLKKNLTGDIINSIRRDSCIDSIPFTLESFAAAGYDDHEYFCFGETNDEVPQILECGDLSGEIVA